MTPVSVLYIVATPLGNLGDLTPRAAKTFTDVDFIAAEDTRVTVKLLNHIGIKKSMISYYEHNLKERGDYILDRIQNGESCALCSDAGMPAISDPGEELVRQAHARGIKVVPIPGASAAITALCVSGLVTSRFVFEGFLPTNSRQKNGRIKALLNEERTIILYEAPHKLTQTLKDLCDYMPADRKLTICRELTKLHEEIWCTTLDGALNKYLQDKPRGEFVLILEGCEKPQGEEITLEQAVETALQLMKNGESATAAAKIAAAKSPFAKSEIYRECLKRGVL